MIAAGGVIGAAAVLEGAGPTSTSEPHGTGLALNAQTARTAMGQDAQTVTAWLDGVGGAPSLNDRTHAALAALAAAEITGSAPAGTAPGNATTAQYPRSDYAVSGDLSSTSQWRDKAASIVGDADATPAGAFQGDPSPLSTPVTVMVGSVQSADAQGQAQVEAFLAPPASSVLSTPYSNAQAVSAFEATDTLGLKASTSDPPASVANWTAAARGEIAKRQASGTLESDTVNISLASQSLRGSNPAAANALNGELRFRQAGDGSFGVTRGAVSDVRSTAEAARALAIGTSDDRTAAISAINWLDAQGTLPASQAVYRLRAHAYDGMLASTNGGGAQEASPAPTAAGGSFFPFVKGPSGLGALSLWLLAGGIGLSLSLVTVDALRGPRQRLYDTVRASPGLHVNELRRRLHMSPSSIEYHLAVLVGAGLVVAEDDGRYKRFYANGAGLGLNPRAPLSRNTLGALRRPHAVALVRALATRQAPATARDLARTLMLHESAVARRLAHLEDSGVLASERLGRSRLYRLADRSAALKALSAVEEAPPLVATGPQAVPLEAEVQGALGAPSALQ